MPVQRSGSETASEELSAYPGLRGVSWWAAVLTAVGATLLGVVYDAVVDGQNLSILFAVLYFLGCVTAVLTVRQASVFTAVVQPPLILFVAVPSAYYLFHHGEIKGVKDILINCGYPLIERFLLMFTTSVVVLLIGIVRWYLGSPNRRTGRTESAAPATGTGTGIGIGAKIAALTGLAGAAGAKAVGAIRGRGDDEAEPRRRSAREETTRRRRPARTTEHAAHVRPPADPDAPPRRRPAPQGYDEAVARRRRPAPEGYADPAPRRRPPRDGEPYPPRYRDAPPPRRRPAADEPRRPTGDGPRREYPSDRPRREGPPGYRGEDPRREAAREPGRPRPRPNPHFDDRGERPEPRQRPSAGGTHHPVSRVRYRGDEPVDPADGYRPRPPRHTREPRD